MMKHMTLKAVAETCKGELVGAPEEMIISGIVTDSREASENALFVALRGERVDGHQFIPQVWEKGAVSLCEKRPIDARGGYILVEDCFIALQEIAQFYREQLEIPIVGITGSVGKTSTKECIASVLSQKYKVLKTEGNFNNEIGVPLTLCRIRDEHEVAVIEMGINHFGEMHRLSKMVKPSIVVMTNIGQCHLEFLGDRDGVLKAKSEIFDFLQKNGTVIVNGDDDKLSTLNEVHGKKTVTFGRDKKNDFHGRLIKQKGLLGTDLEIISATHKYPVSMPLPGEHMIYNALSAAAVGEELGLSTTEIAEGIAKVKPTGGRSNIITTESYTILDDCYNANPVSTCAAIDLLALAIGRKVAILGDMYELGEEELQMHGRVGEYAVHKKIDVLMCVGELSKAMYDQAKMTVDSSCSGQKVYYFESKEKLLEQGVKMLEKDDTILVKASHGMGFAEVVKKICQ